MHSDFSLLWFKSAVIRQPLGVWETGGGLCARAGKAFSQSSIKRQSDDSCLLAFFCLIQWKGLSAPSAFRSFTHLLAETAYMFIGLQIRVGRRRLCEAHSEMFRCYLSRPIVFSSLNSTLKRHVWRKALAWRNLTNKHTHTHARTRLPLIDCLLFYLWCSSN